MRLEKILLNIFDNMQTPVCIFDTKGELVYQNLSLGSILNAEQLELLIADISVQYDLRYAKSIVRNIGGFDYSISVKSIISDRRQLFIAEFISSNQDSINSFFDLKIPAVREVDNKIVSANHAFQNLIGYELDTSRKLPLSELFYPAEIEKIRLYKENISESSQSSNHVTVHLKSKSKTNLICNLMIDVREDANLFMFWDVTGIIEKNDNLIKEHNRLLKLIDYIPVLLFAFDYEDRLIIWNKTATEYSGIDRHTALNKNWREVFLNLAPENFLTKEFFRSIEKKEELEREELEYYVQGQRHVLAFTTYKNEYPLSNISYWGIATDVTESKVAQEEHEELIEELTASRDTITQDAFRAISLNERLADSEEQLRQANATKDKFFSIIAHDLKSPIHSFTNLTEVIIKEFDKLEKEETLELLQAIFNSAKHLTSLLENLLQWSRTQSNRITLQPENIHIDQLIEHNLSLLNQNAANKKISLEHQKAGNQIAYADENMIYTVLRNIISNAIKFTHPGGKIRVISKGLGDTVEVSIIDNGVGMRKEDMDNLFRIDVYHSTMGTQQEKGTGLGLILCNEFIQKNQGKLTVESSIGKGSTFRFVLPIGNDITPTMIPDDPIGDGMTNEEMCDEMLAENKPVMKLDLAEADEEFISLIKEELIPQAKELSDTMLIDDIAEFAMLLKKYAEKYDIADTIEFAENLADSCDNFDLIDIENSLNAFTTLDI